jgi:hypothetical protein
MKSAKVLGSVLIVLLFFWQNAFSQMSWQTVHPPTEPTPLYSVAWTGAEFIAVGANGVCITSPDGLNWTARSTKSNASLFSSAWNGREYAIVGYSDTLLTSLNCVDWNHVPTGTLNYMESIVWCDSMFIAVGDYGSIRTSPNGIVWTDRYEDQEIQMNYREVSLSDSLLIAVGDYPGLVTSTNGKDWHANQFYNLAAEEWLWSAVWTGSQYVVVGNKGLVITSPDGSTYTRRTSNFSGILRSLLRSGNLLVAVGDSGTILTSSDGIGWAKRRSGPASECLHRIAGNGSMLVVACGNGTLLTSPVVNAVEYLNRSKGAEFQNLQVFNIGTQIRFTTCNLAKEMFPMQIQVLNVEGRITAKEEIPHPQINGYIVSSTMKSGTYFLRVSHGNRAFMKKFTILER